MPRHREQVIATHTRSSWGRATALVLSMDAPSQATGTGTALYLDGADVALVRASVVDASGNVVMGNGHQGEHLISMLCKAEITSHHSYGCSLNGDSSALFAPRKRHVGKCTLV